MEKHIISICRLIACLLNRIDRRTKDVLSIITLFAFSFIPIVLDRDATFLTLMLIIAISLFITRHKNNH